jgi:hypothetical protein
VSAGRQFSYVRRKARTRQVTANSMTHRRYADKTASG